MSSAWAKTFLKMRSTRKRRKALIGSMTRHLGRRVKKRAFNGEPYIMESQRVWKLSEMQHSTIAPEITRGTVSRLPQKISPKRNAMRE